MRVPRSDPAGGRRLLPRTDPHPVLQQRMGVGILGLSACTSSLSNGGLSARQHHKSVNENTLILGQKIGSPGGSSYLISTCFIFGCLITSISFGLEQPSLSPYSPYRFL
jgi:hypothetical protein